MTNAHCSWDCLLNVFANVPDEINLRLSSMPASGMRNGARARTLREAAAKGEDNQSTGPMMELPPVVVCEPAAEEEEAALASASVSEMDIDKACRLDHTQTCSRVGLR